MFLFILSNCEKVIDVDVPSIEPKLVIDASFEIFFDENPIVSNTIIRLTLSADYFSDVIPAVTNANVFLTNLSDSTIINFSDGNADGIYEPSNSFIPAENIAYELTIIYDNETYKGVATRVKSTPIIDVTQSDKTLFSGNEVGINVKIQDELDVDNYYFYDFSKDNYSVIGDRFFDGQEYEVPNFYDEDDIELPETITVKMLGISKDYFNYLNILLDQSGENGGGPFQSVPSSLLGNMINTTNDANFPLGYFHIAEADSMTLDLVEKD